MSEIVEFKPPLVTGSGPGGLPTIKEGAAAAQRSERWFRNKMAVGEIRYTMVGRTPYPVPTFLQEMLQANERPAVRQPRRRGG